MQNLIWQERKRLWCGLPWTFTKYSLDNKKLTIDTGFLNKKQDEVRLYRILDVSLTRTLMQRIFGLGTIHCTSTDRSLKNFDIKNIKKSQEIKNTLSDLIEEERKANKVSSREFMTTDEFDEDENDELEDI